MGGGIIVGRCMLEARWGRQGEGAAWRNAGGQRTRSHNIKCPRPGGLWRQTPTDIGTDRRPANSRLPAVDGLFTL